VRLTELGDDSRRGVLRVDPQRIEKTVGRLGYMQRYGVRKRIEEIVDAAKGTDFFNPHSLSTRRLPLRLVP
jgi:hypothetical protein